MKLLAICSMLLAFSLAAQRPEPPAEGGRDHRRGGPGMQMPDRILEKLAQVDPTRAAALKELREQDPEAFRRELRSEMMKHGPTLFRGEGGGGRFDGGRPGGFEGGGRGGFDGRGGAGGFDGGQLRGILEKIRRDDPAKFAELEDTRENDPQAFKDAIIKLAREYGERYKKGRDEVRKIMEVAQRYQASEDEAEKATLREELEGLVAASFDKQQDDKEAWINKLEADLEAQRVKLAERREKRDALIQERLETILQGAPADLRRRPPPKGEKPGKTGKPSRRGGVFDN